MSLEGGPFHCCLLMCAVAIPLDPRSRRRCAGLACAPSLDGADVGRGFPAHEKSAAWKVDQSWIKVRHFESFWRQLLPGAVNIKPSAPLSLEVGSSWDFTLAYLDIWTESPLPTSSEWHFFWMWMMWCRSFRIGSFVLQLCLVSEHVAVSKTCQASPASGRRAWTAGDNTHLHSAYWPIDSYIIPSP